MTEVEEKTEFTFAELSDEAKDTAREKVRDWNVMDDWWDYTYEDAVTVGALMGIEIDDRERRTMSNSTVRCPSISFSGFSSQGDGACYEGRYRFTPDAVAKVKAHAGQDAELHRIAEGLTALQIATHLTHAWTLSCTISTSSRYSHSNTMNFQFNEYDGDPDIDTCDFSEGQDAIVQLLRDFADWIYHQLEAEHDWLTSIECIDEHLADLTFDEDGAQI